MFEVITNYTLSLLQVFKHQQGSLYFFVFITAFLESVPIIGTFMPGTLLLLLFGLFCAKGYVSIWVVVLLSTIGATLGDIGGYLLGKYGRRFFKEHNKILKLAHLESGQAFFEKHGGKSILFGRFIGPIRPVISLVAGATHYIPKRFLKWNVAGAFLWSGTYIVIGFVFAKNIKLIDRIVSQVGGTAFVLLVVLGLTYVYFQKRKKLIKE
jgi:membrane protein DedA with SNARE-associated domain